MSEKILQEAKDLISKGKPFEFWKLLEKSEKECENLRVAVLGTVEEFVAVKGKLSLGKGSVVKSGTRLEGSVYVGENCTIGPNAFLRSGTIIGNNCHIGTSEIKNSIILDGSNIPHFSYVGDSVIGCNCNLGAGTKIANLRHDGATIKIEIEWQVLDSGRRKLGALLFDDVKTGVNSSINCGAILLKGQKVLPNEFRK